RRIKEREAYDGGHRDRHHDRRTHLGCSLASAASLFRQGACPPLTHPPARPVTAPGNELAGNELGRGLCPRRRPPPPGAQDPSASVPAELGAPRALRCWRASASASKMLALRCSMNVSACRIAEGLAA